MIAQPPDHDELIAFAAFLADGGADVRNVEYTPLDAGARYPTPFVELACAVAEARTGGAAADDEGRRIVLLGHSTSAYASSIASVGGDIFADAPCDDPQLPDVFVGIAGWYDIDNYVPASIGEEEWNRGKSTFFGGEVVPEARPEEHLGRNSDLDVLPVHGDLDTDVLAEESVRLHQLLDDAGYSVELEIVPGGDHASVLTPAAHGAAVADLVLAFASRVGELGR